MAWGEMSVSDGAHCAFVMKKVKDLNGAEKGGTDLYVRLISVSMVCRKMLLTRV